jgi:chemotaxis signal transduction protein
VAKPLALLVDRVAEIRHISPDQLLPAGKADSFNACVQAVIHSQNQIIHVFSPRQILLEKEHEILTRLAQREQTRLADWGAAIQ